MLKIGRFVLSFVTILLAAFALITNNFELNHIMFLLLGLLMLVMGIDEYRAGRKVIGLISFAVFIFLLFVSLQFFLLNY